MSLMSQIREFFAPTWEQSQRTMLNPWGDPFTNPYFNFGGNIYPLGLNQTMPGAKQEDIDGSFVSFANQAYKGNSVIFACLDAHRRLFTEARFQFRRMQNGVPGDLFGTKELDILEVPWPNGTTGDLLARMIGYADLAGNFYAARRGNRLAVMRPDWVSIILDAPAEDIDAQIIGYVYHRGGRKDAASAIPLTIEEVAHFAPIPDPLARYRGMSPLTPLIREIQADGAAETHKLRFFENSATPNMVIKRPDDIDPEKFKAWVALMESSHAGTSNAYKTWYLANGADATPVGANLRQLDFANTQGHGETRMAAAFGIPPIIVGLSEGLAAATYSNYGQARRAYADLWARPTWRNAAASLATIVRVPSGSELWYDDRNIPFLAEDQADQANIGQIKAQTVNTYITAGYKADAAIKAVAANDPTLLIGQHTGLFSVQLQAPGSTKMPAGEVPGESPVGPGTKPETIPPGDPTTKPVTSGPPKPVATNSARMFMGISFGELRRLLAEGWQPATAVDEEIIRRAFAWSKEPLEHISDLVPAPIATNATNGAKP
jgi:hypothetical protein